MTQTEMEKSTRIPTGASDELGLLRLSVVIPTYNRRDSLLRTLGAFAKQTHPMKQFEVVVISDGASGRHGGRG